LTNTQTPDREALGHALNIEHTAGYTYRELAIKYHKSPDAIKGLIRTARIKGTPAEFDAIHLPTPLELAGDFLIVGDVHVPATDWNFAQLVGRVAEHTGINRLIIAGDFFNFDLWSRYDHVIAPPTWKQERDAARVLIGDWLETFAEIYTISGNHDQRIAKWSAAEFDEVDTWGMVATSGKLTHSNCGYCTVQSGGQTWRVTHPASYRRGRLSVANELANKYQVNVISFHEHHLGKTFDEYGHYVVVNGGMLADTEKMAYVTLNDTVSAKMVKGFVALQNGCATVYGERPFTDWSFLG
jgi:Calcineurin-like phosphoesterase